MNKQLLQMSLHNQLKHLRKNNCYHAQEISARIF
jgi:hypothetical protein